MDWANWFRLEFIENNSFSIIWNSFIKNINWVKKWLSWDIGNGKHVRVGIDPLVGLNENYKLPEEIINI